ISIAIAAHLCACQPKFVRSTQCFGIIVEKPVALRIVLPSCDHAVGHPGAGAAIGGALGAGTGMMIGTLCDINPEGLPSWKWKSRGGPTATYSAWASSARRRSIVT